MPRGLWSCVVACWRLDPSARPNAKQIITFLGCLILDPLVLPSFCTDEESPESAFSASKTNAMYPILDQASSSNVDQHIAGRMQHESEHERVHGCDFPQLELCR